MVYIQVKTKFYTFELLEFVLLPEARALYPTLTLQSYRACCLFVAKELSGGFMCCPLCVMTRLPRLLGTNIWRCAGEGLRVQVSVVYGQGLYGQGLGFTGGKLCQPAS